MLWITLYVSTFLVLQNVLASRYGSSDFVVSTDYTSRYHGPGTTPVVLPDGTLANTPEVAAARAAHLAALQKAQALWYGNSGSIGASNVGFGGHYSTSSGGHSGSYTSNVVGNSGWLNAARSSWSRSYPSVSGSNAGKAGSYGSAWPSYSGLLASATVLPSGYLADSSDVAQARLAHLRAVSQAYAEAAKWPAESDNTQLWKQ